MLNSFSAGQGGLGAMSHGGGRGAARFGLAAMFLAALIAVSGATAAAAPPDKGDKKETDKKETVREKLRSDRAKAQRGATDRGQHAEDPRAKARRRAQKRREALRRRQQLRGGRTPRASRRSTSFEPDPNAKWACEETTVELPPVWAGKPKLTFDFNIRNEGTADLKIRAKGG